MITLQNELNSYFQKESFQTKLKARIILRKLQNIGFKVCDEFLQCIESQLVNNKENIYFILNLKTSKFLMITKTKKKLIIQN